MKVRRNSGHPLPDTREMQAWREEYKQMSLDEHKAKLRELGLGEEEFKEFQEILLKEKKKK